MAGIESLPRKAKPFSLIGFIKAIEESPAQLLPKLGFQPKIGRIGTGGYVTMRDGTTIQVERDRNTPQPGEKVIVHIAGISE